MSSSSRGSSFVWRVSRAGHAAREEVEQAAAHIQWRCLADHEAAGGVHVARALLCVRSRKESHTLVATWIYIISNAPGRSIPLLMLDVNGHKGVQMVQPKVWRSVARDAIGPRFPRRENFNSGQLCILLQEDFMTAVNTDERFCCGRTYFGPPPLCARTRVDYVCALKHFNFRFGM